MIVPVSSVGTFHTPAGRNYPCLPDTCDPSSESSRCFTMAHPNVRRNPNGGPPRFGRDCAAGYRRPADVDTERIANDTKTPLPSGPYRQCIVFSVRRFSFLLQPVSPPPPQPSRHRRSRRRRQRKGGPRTSRRLPRLLRQRHRLQVPRLRRLAPPPRQQAPLLRRRRPVQRRRPFRCPSGSSRST